MIKRAPRLSAVFAIVGAVAGATAGPSVAHRFISKRHLQLTHAVMGNSIADHDYVKLLTQVSQLDRYSQPTWKPVPVPEDRSEIRAIASRCPCPGRGSQRAPCG